MLCHHGTGHVRHLIIVAVSCTRIRTHIVIVLPWPSPSHASRHRRRCCGLACCRCCHHCHRASASPSPFMSPSSSLLSCLSIASTVVPIALIGVAVVIVIVHPSGPSSSLPRASPWSVTGLTLALSCRPLPSSLFASSLCCCRSLVSVVKPCLRQCTAWKWVGAGPRSMDVCG